MQMKIFCLTLFLVLPIFFYSGKVYGQTNIDSINTESDTYDTTEVKRHSKDPRPKRAAIRSAIIPGWGQFYNGKKSYWKIPVIYGAGGVITWFLVNNYNTFKTSSNEYNKTGNQSARIDRDNFRMYTEWNAMMLLGLYVLNIVDASVTAHLREFDVGENISFRIKPYICPFQNGKPVSGICLNFNFKK